jgi:hypothetical protein
MDRIECENRIVELLREIESVYKQYNPDGKYLAMFINGDTVTANNQYWVGGDDSELPLFVRNDEDGITTERVFALKDFDPDEILYKPIGYYSTGTEEAVQNE